MYTVVVKPFTAFGKPYTTGMLIDTSGLGKEDTLIRARFLRAATPEEVNTASGLTMPTDMERPSRNAKKAVSAPAPEPVPVPAARRKSSRN